MYFSRNPMPTENERNFWTENLRLELIAKNAFDKNRFLNIREFESKEELWIYYNNQNSIS
jgi:hypothetical protein